MALAALLGPVVALPAAGQGVVVANRTGTGRVLPEGRRDACPTGYLCSAISVECDSTDPLGANLAVAAPTGPEVAPPGGDPLPDRRRRHHLLQR